MLLERVLVLGGALASAQRGRLGVLVLVLGGALASAQA